MSTTTLATLNKPTFNNTTVSSRESVLEIQLVTGDANSPHFKFREILKKYIVSSGWRGKGETYVLHFTFRPKVITNLLANPAEHADLLATLKEVYVLAAEGGNLISFVHNGLSIFTIRDEFPFPSDFLQQLSAIDDVLSFLAKNLLTNGVVPHVKDHPVVDGAVLLEYISIPNPYLQVLYDSLTTNDKNKIHRLVDELIMVRQRSASILAELYALA